MGLKSGQTWAIFLYTEYTSRTDEVTFSGTDFRRLRCAQELRLQWERGFTAHTPTSETYNLYYPINVGFLAINKLTWVLVWRVLDVP